MTNKLTFILLFSIISIQILAQKQPAKGVIFGIIVDKASKEPVEFATVVLLTETGNSQITGTTTNVKGKFSFDKIEDGKYKISYSFIAVSYTHLRAHETDSYLVCRLLLEKKKK